MSDKKVIDEQRVKILLDLQYLLNDFFLLENHLNMWFFYLFQIVCNKPHANPTIIHEKIKEIHILTVGGFLEFPILSRVLLRRDEGELYIKTRNEPFMNLNHFF